MDDMADSIDLEIKWVGSCIFLVSIMYTYIISRLTVAPTPIVPSPDLIRTRRHRSIYQDLETRKRRITKGPFPVTKLPPELCLQILGHCSEWPESVARLVLVSRRIQELTYESCLPRMAIRLIGEHQVESFDRLLLHKPRLFPYIRHLWVTPLHEEYYPAVIRILKRCTHVRSLAVNARILEEAIISPHIGYRLRHTSCRKLTLLHTSSDGWTSLFKSTASLQFLQRISHLRLVGDRVPDNFSLPNLSFFSYTLNRNTLNLVHGERMLQDKDKFPALRSVILTGERRGHGGGARISKMKDSRFFIFEVPPERTELTMWSDNTLGRGFWQLCAD